MHFSLLLVTEKQPTNELIAQYMAPFDENGEGDKWDWYQVGGRWTGYLDGYDPEKDPVNTETCSICGGTGKRDDELGRRTRQEDPTYTCNGCRGKGSHVSWPTQWKERTGDRLQVKALPNPPKPTFAVLRENNWFGRNWSDHDDDPKWHKQFEEIFASLSPETWIAIIDCHT